MVAILVKDLKKKYGNDEVLHGLDLRIEEGEFYALMGPNGSGKTTLVSILSSVSSPTDGKVEIYGKTPESSRELVGYVPQESFSSPKLSGRENLDYFAELLGYSGRQRDELVNEALERVGLLEDADKRVSDYSGGMRKRLEVASTFLLDAKILILDEPTTGLDPGARRKFLGLVREIKGEDKTVFLVTHIGADAETASRVGLIDEGEIVAEGSPEKLRKMSGHESVVDVDVLVKGGEAAKVLRKFSRGGELLETESGYTIYCENAEETTPKIVKALDEIDCKARGVKVVEPSLEDVFYDMTGKAVREVS